MYMTDYCQHGATFASFYNNSRARFECSKCGKEVLTGKNELDSYQEQYPQPSHKPQ